MSRSGTGGESETAANDTLGGGAADASERMALVRALQAQAMARPDPLAANLGVITADLIGFAHTLAAAVQAALAREPGPAEGRQQASRDAELYLKFARQIDRLAQLERQLTAPPAGRREGPAGLRGPGGSEKPGL